ncbi:hypothetical protein AAC691_12805 [Nguyenibacter vanlangensis]|uniref:MobA/MobL protein domain-containing protein n=1 Tax=Nguyenibacter vanlangensis TaxID=1216886 RepID=A0ABZ3D0H7_9PROT
MILKTSRIKTASGPHALIRHLWHGKGNDEITTVQGSKSALVAMMQDAQAAGRTYGIRHLVISPEDATSRAQATEILRLHGQEFGYEVEDCTLIEHRKPRHDGGGYEVHWHAAIPEIRQDGNVLDSRFMFKRNEVIARLAEVRLGHALTQGRHNTWAAAALEQRGLEDEAAAVRVGAAMKSFGPAARPAPRESYSADTHQILKRSGIKTPAIKAAITAAWAARDAENCLPFIDTLHHAGIDLVPGRRPGTWVAVADGIEVTALHRLLKVKTGEVEAEMAKAAVRKAPAWARATGGYDALGPQDRSKAEQGFDKFREIYERARGHEYPYGIADYVAWCQKEEARKPFHERTPKAPAAQAEPEAAPRPQAAPSAPKSLPLPDDPAALRRIIGEPRWSERNRDPQAIAAAYQQKVNGARARAERALERAEATIERTAPSDIVKDGKLSGKLADAAAKLAIGMLNLVLRPLGLPITWQPSFGAPRIVGQNPGNPRDHEAAHRDAEEIREKLAGMATPDVIRAKAAEVAAVRQAEHDAWADKTAPARLKLSEIEARQEAERQEQERRAKAEEARMAAALGAVEVDLPDFAPETDILRGLEI